MYLETEKEPGYQGETSHFGQGQVCTLASGPGAYQSHSGDKEDRL